MGEVKDAVLLIIKYTFNLAGSWNVALGTLASASVWLNALASQLNQRQEGGWRERERERGSTVEGILPFQFSFSLKCDVCLTLASSLFRWPEERNRERERERSKKERKNENHTARKNIFIRTYIFAIISLVQTAGICLTWVRIERLAPDGWPNLYSEERERSRSRE